MKHLPFTRSSEIIAELPRKPGSQFETVDTIMLSSNVLMGLFELSNRAAAGESDAAELLLGITQHGTTELRALLSERPDILKDVVLKCPQFPLMTSLHPENERANREFLKKIKLGEKSEINAHSGSRWDRNNPATTWANDVLETLRANQRRFKVLMEEPPTWVAECSQLPPLSKETAGAWWKVGKQALLERFPEPHKIPELATLAENESDDSRKKHRVLGAIGNAIRALASK